MQVFKNEQNLVKLHVKKKETQGKSLTISLLATLSLLNAKFVIFAGPENLVPII
jgi:hypothetical protein